MSKIKRDLAVLNYLNRDPFGEAKDDAGAMPVNLHTALGHPQSPLSDSHSMAWFGDEPLVPAIGFAHMASAMATPFGRTFLTLPNAAGGHDATTSVTKGIATDIGSTHAVHEGPANPGTMAADADSLTLADHGHADAPAGVTAAAASAPIVDAVSATGSAPAHVAPALPDAAMPGGSPGLSSNTVYATGYNPTTDTAQWNFAKLFGSAATAQTMLAKFNGAGVHVADYDDGIDKSVSALMTHYDASRELVINGVKADPGILTGGGQGVHGTATNGIIGADASKTNGQVSGLAYGASLTDVNLFSGAASGSGMLSAIKQMSTFDVTNNSWGWSSKWADLNGGTATFGGQFVSNLAYAGTAGRGGLGTIIVKSSGNDWLTDHRDAATQEFNVDRHVVTVGAVGDNDDVAYYSQRGASVLTSGPSNGYSKGITTTDRTGAAGYSSGDTTSTFGGTSASAPEVTSVVADMLGANGKLGARDVQAILALASHDNETAGFTTAATGNMAYGWTVNHAAGGFNGGGYHFSNDEGFGELNAHDAIRESLVWNYMTPVAQTFNNEMHLAATAAGKAVPTSAGGALFTFNVTGAETVENADLTLNVSTANLDHLKVVLTSASGTQSIVLDASTTTQGETGNSATGGVNLTLGSHAFLGEASQGFWTAQVIDTTTSDNAKVNSATLDLYGSAQSPSHQFHYTDEAAKMDAADPTRLVLHDKSGIGSWIDTAMMTGSETIDLRTGQTSYENGKAFVTIGSDTTVNKVTLGDGASTVRMNDNGDTAVAGSGTMTATGGNGNDTFIAGYGSETVTGGAGKDSFVFDHKGFGTATITDFTKGSDLLDLRGLGDTFSGLKIADNGSTITISNIDAQGDTIVLSNTHNQHLAAADFLFA